MSVITDYSKQSELALAAYAGLSSGISGAFYRKALEDAGMSQFQAERFAERWRVIDQSPASASGFSATVFAEISSGKRYLAIRGTEGFFSIDTLADAQLLFGGAARNQIVSLYNYVQRLVTPAGQPAIQVEDAGPDIDPVTGFVNDPGGIRATTSVVGLGHLSGVSGVTVTGHSLGGHLAAAANYLFPTLIGATFTYNAPGFSLDYAKALLDQFPGSATAFPASITNLVAHAGADIIAAVGTLPGVPVRIEIENQLPNLVGNHSIVTLTDALAIYALYSELAPSLSEAQITQLFKSASATNKGTLEGALDALRKILLGADAAVTAEEDREAFYANLYALQDSGAYQGLEGSAAMRLTVLQSRDTLMSNARTDFGYFLAVKHLLPVALEGTAGVLAGVHGDLYGEWQADRALTPEQRKNGEANYSDDYLADRAALLAWKLKYGLADGRPEEAKQVKAPWRFEDKATGAQYELTPGGAAYTRFNQVVFGKDDAGETLSGDILTDRLYGGGGDDTLKGERGSDHLEGGVGNDTLVGGKDNDILRGGAGQDIYEFAAGDGIDTIEDSDGAGAIKIGPDTLSGGKETYAGSGQWESADKRYRYTQRTEADGSKTLIIATAGADGDRIFVKTFTSGNLGIELESAVAPVVPTPVRTVVGDLMPIDIDLGRPGIQFGYDDLGNMLVYSDTPASGWEDRLYDSAGDDIVEGKAGDDTLLAQRGGADLIDGGDGNDYAEGGAGADRLIGGDGQDRLFGEGDNDRLYATSEREVSLLVEGGRSQSGTGSRGDWLDGQDGDDMVAGDNGNDALLGGDGADLIVGGGGDDDIYGDLTTNYAMASWRLERRAEQGDEVTRYKTIWHDAQFRYVAGGADLIYGGTGEDWISAGAGDDIAFGETDKDVLFGEAGNDVLSGGEGDDVISGDNLADGTPDGLDGSLHGDDVLFGDAGKDKMEGNGGNDVLHGGVGDDEMNGDDTVTSAEYHGNDVIDGGEGNDRLWGMGKDDRLKGGEGDDHLEGDYDGNKLAGVHHGKDYLEGGKGNDSLFGQGECDTLYGGKGDDFLYGDDDALAVEFHGDDYLDGGEGQDRLYGGGGNDLLVGGLDADYLNGGSGDDTYVIGAGEAPLGANGETIEDAEGNNTAILGGASTSDLTLHGAGNDLLLTWAGGAEGLIVVNGLSGTVKNYDIGGEALTYQQLANRYLADSVIQAASNPGAVLVGGAVADDLSATGGGAMFYGGAGNDTLAASGGNNTYHYAEGDGNDSIRDTSAKTDPLGNPAPNVLKFGIGIRPGDIALSLRGGALVLSIGGAQPGEIVLEVFDKADPMANPSIDRYEFDGNPALSFSALLERGIHIAGTSDNDPNIQGTAADDVIDGGAGADAIYGNDGNDTIFGGDGDDYLKGLAGSDRLDGGSGDDYLEGWTGDDTFVFGRGYGRDTVNAYDSGAGTDVIELTEGIAEQDLSVWHVGDDLMVRVKDTGDTLTVLDHFVENSSIDGLRFANGTYWDRAMLEARVTPVAATPFDDNLTLSAEDDIVDALAGNDYLYGRGGNDWLMGGDDHDYLYGEGGNDRLEGGGGVDRLDGGAGDDMLVGGKGDDTLIGGNGSDTYFFDIGDGQDVVSNWDSTPGKVDRLVFGNGIAPESVTLYRNRIAYNGTDELWLTLGGGGDRVRLSGYFASYGDVSKVDRIEFADGTVWSIADVKRMMIAGNDKAQTLTGYDSGDTIDGGGGNDYIFGDKGDDTLYGGGDNDQLYGESGNDWLEGGAGDDFLSGDALWNGATPAAGNDTLIGGAGNDRLEGGGGDDVYRFGRGQGADRLLEGNGSVAGGTDEIRLDAGIGAEAVTLVRTSDGTGADDLVLVLDGSGEQLRIEDHFDATQDRRIERVVFEDGLVWNEADIAARIVNQAGIANTQTGTAGNDAFTVDHPQDQIVEQPGQGNDTVSSSVSYTLPGNVENLTLTGMVNIDGTGNSSDNVIRGNSGNNRLDGGGGYNDQLIGGRGDDIYVVTTQSSNWAQVVELQGEGNDTVLATSYNHNAYALPANVENVVYEERSIYTGESSIIGNALDNTIAIKDNGASYQFILDGGTGADTLIGGKGSDTYIVDSPDDTVIETGGLNGGFDTVKASFDYVLGRDIEALVLTGSATVGGTGNSLNNTLDGSQNAAANRLAGGAGNDTYIVGDGDSIAELAGEGVDTVVIGSGFSGTTFSLSWYDNVEAMTLGDALGASNIEGTGADDTLTGNSASNTILGGGGDDVLYDGVRGGTQLYGATDFLEGGEGNDRLESFAGKDVLDGGAGNDTLVSHSATCRFSGMFGDDTVFCNSGYTKAVFADLAAKDVQLERSGNDLVIRGPAGSGTVTVKYHFLTGLESISFADGVYWDNVQIGIRVAQGNAVTEGDDVVLGNAGADIISLLGGNDAAWGAEGDDTITAGVGVDWIYGGDGADQLIGGSGTSFLFGDNGDDVLHAGSGATYMTGGQGMDTFVWGAGDGAGHIFAAENTAGVQWIDTLQIRAGTTPEMIDVVRPYEGADDLELRIRGTTDVITLAGFFFTDQDRCEVDQVRFDNGTVWLRDELVLRSRSKYGTDAAETLTGDSGDNRLYGLGGNDTLNGLDGNDFLDGGSGTDTLRGGAGNDTYVVDNTGDIVTESANQGIDTVLSSVTWTLGSNIEHLTLTGSAAVNGTGNSLANTIIGNIAANVLSGGSGADTLVGGAGNDTYIVDNVGDVVTELADEGTDLVQSSVTYTLGNNVENLTLTGTSATSGTGNAFDNVLIGNSANNTLTGNAGNDTLDGGSGNDTMRGGTGNDIYVVNATGDVVTENSNEGIDLVRSSITYTLGNNVENLTLTGSSIINGTGNALDNVLIGNSANNTLAGNAGNDTLDGGSGNDTLTGGLGNDTYMFGRGYGSDTVTENDATSGNTDVASFLSGIGSDQIWFRRVGNNLESSIIGTSDKLTINNWYLGNQYHVEQFKTADGHTLLDTQVENLVQAMAAFSPPAAGETTLPPAYQTALAPVIAANWQ
ncbi:MAG: calcium-binding protein [Pseudomonadota bacterium]|jgi:Ca2+-binding RTX toxin-like protein